MRLATNMEEAPVAAGALSVPLTSTSPIFTESRSSSLFCSPPPGVSSRCSLSVSGVAGGFCASAVAPASGHCETFQKEALDPTFHLPKLKKPSRTRRSSDKEARAASRHPHPELPSPSLSSPVFSSSSSSADPLFSSSACSVGCPSFSFRACRRKPVARRLAGRKLNFGGSRRLRSETRKPPSTGKRRKPPRGSTRPSVRAPKLDALFPVGPSPCSGASASSRAASSRPRSVSLSPTLTRSSRWCCSLSASLRAFSLSSSLFSERTERSEECSRSRHAVSSCWKALRGPLSRRSLPRASPLAVPCSILLLLVLSVAVSACPLSSPVSPSCPPHCAPHPSFFSPCFLSSSPLGPSLSCGAASVSQRLMPKETAAHAAAQHAGATSRPFSRASPSAVAPWSSRAPPFLSMSPLSSRSPESSSRSSLFLPQSFSRSSSQSSSLSSLLLRARSRKFARRSNASAPLSPAGPACEVRYSAVSAPTDSALFAVSPAAAGSETGQRPEGNLRNVAIVAHVDHGKTTLVDALLVHAAELQSACDLKTSWDLEKRKSMQRMMDTGQLEKERGITITAKVCSLRFKDGRKVNIIDTPGHADFSGEVERVMHLADGVLLVVDAVEGCKPQTRVVLQKALQAGLRAVVVVNKVDRTSARPVDVSAQVFDLFLQLDATEEQAEFEVVYTSALNRQSGLTPSSLVSSMDPLVDAIMRLPSPHERQAHASRSSSLDSSGLASGTAAGTGAEPAKAPLQMQIAHVDRNAYRGVMAMGKLLGGALIPGMPIGLHRPGEPLRKATFTGVFEYDGMDLRELSIDANAATDAGSPSSSPSSPASSPSPVSPPGSSLSAAASSEGGAESTGVGDERKGGPDTVTRSPSSLAGDILVLAGVSADVRVGDSVVDLLDPRPLAPLNVADPSVSIQVLVNTSPLAGKEVETPTSGTLLRQRLLAMTERDVSLRVDTTPDDDGVQSGGGSCLLRLSGRGPLHLALVLETLRREGFELVVAAPSVLPRWRDDGELLEPVEEMEVAVPQEHIGTIINEVKQRKGDLVDVTNASSTSSSALSTLVFRLPTRKAFGLRSAILTASKGTASIHAAAGGYQVVPKGEETDGLVKIARKDRHAMMGSSAEVSGKRHPDKSGSVASKGCNAFIPKEGAKQSGGFNIKRGIEGAGAGKKKDRGFLVATEEGTVTGKGALSAQERGQLFVSPGDQVYGGMIVGLNSRGGDLPINVCKAKKLTNMRAAHKEISEGIVPPIEVTLDYGMEIIGANEVMEVTPRSIRLAVRSAMRR